MRNSYRLALRCASIASLLLTVPSCGEHHATAAQIPGSPRLLLCTISQTQSTSVLVTTLGGAVSLGATSVSIPSGALTSATTIALTIPASQYMEIEVKANDLTSFLFQQPVSITIDYSRCSASEASKAPLTVWHIDTQTKQLLENLGGTDNKTNHSITFTTGHLSGYAVAF